jgi:hypothetical protein
MGYESPFNALLEYTKTLALKKLKIPPNNIKFSYDSNGKFIPPIVRPTGYVFTWNTLVKKATGYDAFISTKGTIHGGEPIQAMFLSPEKLQVISMITIPKAKKQGMAEGENWSKHNNPRAGGMSQKSVKSYRRSHPGSKIQTAVTKKPSKLKKGSKDAKRRSSFCARMKGMKKHNTSAKTAHDPDSNINKSLRRWNCESVEQLNELVMLAEQLIQQKRKTK